MISKSSGRMSCKPKSDSPADDTSRNKYPQVPGRLVLQDRPSVIEGIEQLDPIIERMEYDFYLEQPLKAARAYYMHSVLHDWPDDVCRSGSAARKRKDRDGARLQQTADQRKRHSRHGCRLAGHRLGYDDDHTLFFKRADVYPVEPAVGVTRDWS